MPTARKPVQTTDSAARTRRREAPTELFRRAAASSGAERERIRQQLVINYLGIADAVAHRFASRPQDWSDVRQVAYVGLIKAVDRFDPELAADFASFAVPTIAGEIKRHLRDNGWVVRPPRSLQELHGLIVKERSCAAQDLGHDPSPAELAERIGEDPARVAEAVSCRNGMSPVSLDTAVHEDDDGTTLADTIGFADVELERAELVQTLRSACRCLSARERRILYLRFFREQTQSEIAVEIGVTQMQVSRLLTKILGALRGALPELAAA